MYYLIFIVIIVLNYYAIGVWKYFKGKLLFTLNQLPKKHISVAPLFYEVPFSYI